MDSYESRVTAIVDAAHERAARFAAELREEEQAFREAAVRDSEELEQDLQRAVERSSQPEQPQATLEPSRGGTPSWADDDDFSDETWLEDN
ncbi:hypothetical protein ABT324_00430 [Saccharopolyspora sp. NPDC000359]|uniref:hypothetical protein n=1 Tax=Saccharopolyspora sp. NPDC000359 TaxID=3154251 RepID=UPI00331D4895